MLGGREGWCPAYPNQPRTPAHQITWSVRVHISLQLTGQPMADNCLHREKHKSLKNQWGKNSCRHLNPLLALKIPYPSRNPGAGRKATRTSTANQPCKGALLSTA